MRKEKCGRLELASKIARVAERSSPHWVSVERRIDNRRVSLSVRPMCMPGLSMGKPGLVRLTYTLRMVALSSMSTGLHSDIQISLARVKISLENYQWFGHIKWALSDWWKKFIVSWSYVISLYVCTSMHYMQETMMKGWVLHCLKRNYWVAFLLDLYFYICITGNWENCYGSDLLDM